MTCRCAASPELIAAEVKLFGSHACERLSMRAWHTEECAERLEDPGEVCGCRPPRGESIAIDFGRKR